MAYAERIHLEAAVEAYEGAKDGNAKKMLHDAIRLHCLKIVKKDLGWYLTNGIISHEAAKAIDGDFDETVRIVATHANDWIAAFNLPQFDHLHAPINRDYVTYSGEPDFSKVEVAGKIWDHSQARL